ncbi:MAG TPA: phosphatase PAP2 family protein [Candidatus Binatus sp.]|nr:phosphatase PAP2 family protein [Candidatus Binatus sp.]
MSSDQERAPEGRRSGSRVDAGATTQHGPLGKVDPAHPARRGTVPRPPLGVATGAVVAGLIALVGVLFLFGSIAEQVREQEAFALDSWATPFLHGIRSPLLDAVMTGFTTMGSSLILVPLFAAAAIVLLVRRRYGALLFLSLAIGGALVIDFTMKLIFQRPRPKLDYAAVLPDYSFPSGHSMNGIVFYVGLALVAWSIFGRRVGITATILGALLALGIGISRIYLGYHYLTDVVGGFLAGIAWLLIVGAVLRIRPTGWSLRLPMRRLLR